MKMDEQDISGWMEVEFSAATGHQPADRLWYKRESSLIASVNMTWLPKEGTLEGLVSFCCF